MILLTITRTLTIDDPGSMMILTRRMRILMTMISQGNENMNVMFMVKNSHDCYCFYYNSIDNQLNSNRKEIKSTQVKLLLIILIVMIVIIIHTDNVNQISKCSNKPS